MQVDYVFEISLDHLLESHSQHPELWKPSMDQQKRHCFGRTSKLSTGLHCFEVPTCILITVPSRICVWEAKTVPALSSLPRIAAGKKGKWGKRWGRKVTNLMAVKKKKKHEGVWMRQWLCQGVTPSKHHQSSAVVIRFASGWKMTLW